MEDQPLLSQHTLDNPSSTFSIGEKSISQSESTIIMPTAIDHMNSYKGQGSPNPMLPIGGIACGIITPYALFLLLNMIDGKTSTSNDKTKIDNVLLVLQSMSLPAFLFFSEFIFGAIARSKSPKATFSPAAVQASGCQPFEIIEANRIHQNQIESACIYIPASLSAAAAGANGNVLVATTITWVVGRMIYRYGYSQHDYPLWRVVGLEVSLTQSLICFGLFAYSKYNNE
jgi:uncharacterized MAPEG superfamily protein